MNHFFVDIKEHFSHYSVLVFILLFGILSFFYFQRYAQAQIFSILLTSTFYVIWGIIHHYLEKDLHPRIILEYLAVALLGFLVIWSIINRA